MASTYTTRLKLERQASGENSGNWGNLTNYVLNRIDSTVRGYVAVSVAGSANVTLVSNTSTTNTAEAADDQVHNKVIEFTGALTGAIHVFTDAVEGDYTLFNNTSGSHTLTFANTGHAANGVAITQGQKALVYTTGTAIVDVLAGAGLGNVSTTGTQTLTNKTLTDPILSPAAATAGKIEFLEGTNNGTNKVTLIGPAATADVTVTLPAATDTLVGKATTDTLTNKTINGSQLSNATVPLGKLANGTDGNIISYDASGVVTAVATGSSGQVLTSAGAGAVPSFQSPAGGGKVGQVIVAKGTASVGSVTSVGSYADFGSTPTISITPSASNSVVLIEFTAIFSAGGSSNGCDAAIADSSNNLITETGMYGSQRHGLTMWSLHSANTTNAVTYKIRGKVNSSGGHHFYLDSGTSNPERTTYFKATEILA